MNTRQLLGSASASEPDRIQIWQYQPETPWDGKSPYPEVQSVRWSDGDVEVLFTQAAPCDGWLPVNPVWDIEQFNVTLNFTWVTPRIDAPEPKALCTKHVRAWVFRVPNGPYSARFGASVQVFSQSDGRVTSKPLGAN